MSIATIRRWAIAFFLGLFSGVFLALLVYAPPNLPAGLLGQVSYSIVPATILVQITLLGIWGGLAAPAIYQRVYFAVIACVLGLFFPVGITILFAFPDGDMSIQIAWVMMLLFVPSLVGSLLLSRVRRWRLVPVNQAGIGAPVIGAQFSLGFLSIMALSAALIALLIQTCRTAVGRDPSVPTLFEVLLPGAVIIMPLGLACFVFAIAIIWILLRPKPFGLVTFYGLVAVLVILVAITVGLCGFGFWWTEEAIDPLALQFFVVCSVVAFGLMVGAALIMRWLRYRLVRIGEPNVVAKSPAEARAEFVLARRRVTRFAIQWLRKPWVGGPLVLLFAWLLYDWFLFDGRIRVSKETTYITEPLKADGTVDYGRAINEWLKGSITPEENAAVDLLRVLGPQAVPEDGADEFYRWLEIEPPPAEGDYVILYEDFPPAVAAAGGPRPRGLPYTEKTWTLASDPVTVAWLEANRSPIDKIRAAARKPDFFLPLQTYNDERMIFDDTEFSYRIRLLGGLLEANAMYELKRGNWQSSLDDIAAIGRIGQHLMRRGTLFKRIIAGSFLRIRQELQSVLIEHIDSEELPEFVKLSGQLRLQPFPNLVDSCGFVERMMYLDSIAHLKHSSRFLGISMVSPDTDPLAPLVSRSADWNEVLRHCNASWDECELALAVTDRDTRLQLLGKLDHGRELYDRALILELLPNLLWTRKLRGQGIAPMVNEVLMPEWTMYELSYLNANSRLDLDEISLALEAFRGAKGDYPAGLGELVPEFLEKLPLDRFNDRPYSYTIAPGGYWLYGVGRDGKDDGGSLAKDVVVRINRLTEK